MYGTTQNPPEFYEEDADCAFTRRVCNGVNQFKDLETEEKRDTATICNTAGFVLLFVSCYGIAVYILFYLL